MEDFFDAIEAPRSTGRKEKPINNDDNEFVMIDHPEQSRVANNHNHNQDPFLTETEQEKNSSKPDVAETIEPVLKGTSTFDTVFGVVDNQEDEPVMVSSFTDESEVSASTNSSTHRVAPAPPPSRKTNKQQRNVESPPPPAIFGSINETNVSDFNSTSSSLVTPATVPFDHSLFNQVKPNDQEVIMNAKGEKQGVDRGVKEDPKSITTLPNKGGEEKKKKKKNIVSWAKTFGAFDFNNGNDADKKKKKKDKKKAKEETPVSVPKVKKENTSNNNTLFSSRNETVSEQPPQLTTATSTTTSIPTYDPDTIQGSHIAELVNMGFEPAAALEALDRYDQDIEKATNYLLDQTY